MIVGAVLVMCLGQLVPPPDQAESESLAFRERLAAIQAEEFKERTELASRFKKDGKTDLSTRIEPKPIISAPKDGAWIVTTLPEIVPARVPTGLANVEAGKTSPTTVADPPELSKLLKTFAERYFQLGMKSATAKVPRFAQADHCFRMTLERDPDHAEARRLLGFVSFRGGWATPYAVEQLTRNRVPHPVYGWVDATWIPHLEKGELPTPPGVALKWLPAAEADSLRSSFARPWQISTEHFQISTNVPLSEAIQFGQKLEALHDIFLSRLADLLGLDLPLAQRIRNPQLKPGLPKQRHRVFYFAKKEEYVQYLEPFSGPGIAESLGIYISTRDNRRYGGISYFFRDLDGQLPVEATLFHEGSHQILFESAGADSFRDNSSGFWVFEGMGTYFETLTPEPEGLFRVGGRHGLRMVEARVRLLDQKELVPLVHFVRYRRTEFLNRSTITLHYAQAMALTVFLLHGKDGAYREGFLDYVRDAYKGRLTLGGRGLEDRLGVTYEQLQKEFVEYLKEMPRTISRAEAERILNHPSENRSK